MILILQIAAGVCLGIAASFVACYIAGKILDKMTGGF